MHSLFHTSCITDPRLAKGEKASERANRIELDRNPRRSRSDEKGRETTELSRLTRRRFRQLRNSKALSSNLLPLESLLATKNIQNFGMHGKLKRERRTWKWNANGTNVNLNLLWLVSRISLWIFSDTS